MAQSADIAWEVQTGGAATNGGGFKFGASGTDYSQQTSPQYSVTDLVTDGSATVTSTAANWGTDVVGNVMYVQGGTGSISAGWYEIVSRNAANSVVLDRSTGLTAGSGATSKVGGCLDSLNTLASAMKTIGQWAFVKAGAGYTITASPTFTLNGTPSDTVMFSRISGYTTTRGDGGRPTLTLSGSSLIGISLYNTGSGYMIENFDINCASQTNSSGISDGGGTSSYNCIRNVKVSNFTGYGIRPSTNYSTVMDCEVTGGTGSGAAIGMLGGSGMHALRNWIHDNATIGIYLSSANGSVGYNLVTNNSGASSDGILCTLYGLDIFNNTVYKSGRHGIYLSSNFQIPSTIRNNLITDHTAVGAAGIKFNGNGPIPATPFIDGNAFYNNTANRTNGDKQLGVSGVSPGVYTNVLDVVLTADPFVNKAGNDFTLNRTAGGGLACRNAGTPGALPGLASQLGYMDMGCYQGFAASLSLVGGGLVRC